MKLRALIPCAAAAVLLGAACTDSDKSLGQELVDYSRLFNTYTVEFNLEEIQMKASSDLSGFSDSRITIGAIRDDVFGLTTRESAFSLIPALDTLDMGTNPKAISFDLYFEADTVSCADDSQRSILQNLYVTELTEPLSLTDRNTTRSIPHGETLITDGLPVVNGSSPLSFYFTQEFAQKYVDVVSSLGPVLRDRVSENGVNKYDEYIKKLPGIHIRTDVPEGNGGRINLFNLSALSVASNQFYRNNNLALLRVNSTWNGVNKDSTFVFLAGEPEFLDEKESTDAGNRFYQYAFNRTTHTTVEQPASDMILVEGGGGLKPVILARELQEKTTDAILEKGGDPKKAIVVKGSIILPFEMPEDYLDMKYFPSVLSPTVRTLFKDSDGVESISFAGLTDASVSTEDQGDIDRSNMVYSPDITYHLQEVLRRTDLDTATDADIWLLTIHTEKVAEASGVDNSYYQQMMYAMYYNSLYGGGYGGYGGYGYGGYGYGGYGYGGYGGYGGYSNYYSYMMLAQMMAAQSQQQYSYNTELDKDRYYCGKLCGPQSKNPPKFRVTFALPKE